MGFITSHKVLILSQFVHLVAKALYHYGQLGSISGDVCILLFLLVI